MKKYLDPALLDFLSPEVTPEQRAALTVSFSGKVPVVCAQCHVTREVTFFSAYRQRRDRGMYVCRACQAKVNGKAAARGLEKRRLTNLSRYGVAHPMQLPVFQEKCYRAGGGWFRVHKERLNHTPAVHAAQQARNLEKYGVPYTTLLPQCQQTITARKTSDAENAVRTYLETLTGTSWASSFDIIPPKQLDGYSPLLRAAFEYCGLVWHSERMGKTRETHAYKYHRCREQGIRLFTIFEDEWRDHRQKVEYVLAAQLGYLTHRLYARNTRVGVVSTAEAHQFLHETHLQGAPQHTLYAWGLYDVGERLQAVMTFGLHHRPTKTQHTIVLTRLSFAPGTYVLGGASKLFCAAIPVLMRNYQRVLSWSDQRWSWGRVYETLGFQRDAVLPPDYAYVDLAQNVRLNKQQCTRLKLGAAPGQTEYARAQELGYSRIWDCGKTRWVYSLA